MNHEELIQRCRKSDRKAQNLLFKTFERKVLGICLRYGSSVDDAKDMQQEAFIRIFQSIVASRETIESLEGWIARITVNTAIDIYRRQKRFSALPIENDVSSSVDPDVLHKANEDELMALIKAIPDPYRIVFNLYIIEGHSHREVAELLGITESSSRSYLVRAKTFLQKSLQTYSKDLKKTKVVWTT